MGNPSILISRAGERSEFPPAQRAPFSFSKTTKTRRHKVFNLYFSYCLRAFVVKTIISFVSSCLRGKKPFPSCLRAFVVTKTIIYFVSSCLRGKKPFPSCLRAFVVKSYTRMRCQAPLRKRRPSISARTLISRIIAAQMPGRARPAVMPRSQERGRRTSQMGRAWARRT